MKHLLTAGVVTLGLFAFGATTASAAVICNDEGDCWKTKETYSYPPKARVHIYDDDYVVDTKKYKLRKARPGRGYWSGGAWVDF